MEISSSAQEKLNRLDKGLSSLLFHEQVEILAQAINFVEENPFPYFVNTLMVRLAKAFRAERSIYSNAVRLRIVKLVEECSPYLNVVFSRDQIVQEVIYVSHSTDFKARCLMLMFLEKLAPIIYDNKNFHHLLLESLDSSYQLEVTAAISASSALAQHSFEFASAVVEKLSGMVCSQQTDFSTKLRVINLMATFKENFEVTKKCMALANRLLRENFDQSLTVAILASLTSLAYRSSLGVTEQIALLFTQLYKAVPQRGLIKAILGCLQKLAQMPHHWSNTQITQLLDFMEKIRDLNSSLVFRSWLRCLEILTTTGIHSRIIHEKLGTCWTLLSEPDLAVRISAIKVFMNILFKLPSEQLHVIMFEALVNTCSDLKATNQVVNKKKFYKLLTDYLKTGSCPQTGTARIMEHLLKTSPEDQDFELVLDSLNVICDSDPEACPYISAWAQAILRQADFSKRQPPLALISLFLAPVEMSEEKAKILFDKVVDYVDDFMVYRIARTAFRNGHWKLVAAPLLESINEKTESRETKNWLVALTNIAHSQVTQVEAEDFAAGHNFLNQAFLLLGKFESLDLATQDFNFNYRYVQCLQTTFYVTTKILEMLNHNRFYLTAVSEAPNVQKVISVACDDLAKMVIEKSLPRWNNLYSRSFDADQQTLFHIQLWTIYTNCLISVLQFFCQESINHFQMAVNPDLNTTNRQFQSMVFWMKSQVDKFWERTHPEVTKRVTELNLQLLQNLLEKFWSTPIYMPRYFFQNLHKTVIKLNLLPQPKEKDGSISIPARRLPVTVEGRIQTNNPNRIETLTINLTSYPLKDSTDQAKYSRNVELQENENYFKAQFLLNLLKSTKITVSLTFTDVNTKRSWECDATAQLIVSVNE